MSDAPAIIGRVGRYDLIERLGAGGMGEVFLARATGAAGFEKRVVIKTILPHLEGDESFVERFLDEGKLVVQLRHANIAQVLDMGEDGGVPYIAMELVDGRDLRELGRLARAADKPIPHQIVVSLLIKVLEALDYAHHITDHDGRPLDIIHRDGSPSNVMVSRSGEVKLVDFGIARAADRLGQSVSGAVKGKFSYMSPQQAAGRELDGRSDQFSVGVMAWELLVGTRPFDGDSDLQTLDRIRRVDPGSLAAACPDAPPEVVDAVDRMLAKQPEARFEDAGEAARALHAYLFRTEQIVGARELASWVADVIALLPPDKRGRPGVALSLDDALRLSLGADPGGAQATGTVSVAGALDVVPAAGRGLELQIPDTIDAALDPESPLRAPSRPITQTHTQTDTATAVGAQTRGRLVGVLVALNMLLLAAVGLLIWQATLDDEAPSGPTRAAVEAGQPGSGDLPGSAAVPAAPVPSVIEPASVVAAEADSLARPAADVGSTGTALGAVLAGLALPAGGEPPAEGRAVAAPSTGDGGGDEPEPTDEATGRRRPERRDPAARKAGSSKLTDERPPAAPPGTVRFRYFPASATVAIDGKPVPTGGSNRVDADLAPGPHTLRLTAGRDRVLTRGFRVTAGKITNLATLTVPDGAEPDPGP